jgi:hypothetical protein
MKRRLRALAIVSLLGGLAAGGVGGWMYYRALRQAEAGMNLQKKSLELYDQSDTFKGTPEEDRLTEEGRKYEQAGDATLASARSSRIWAMVSGIVSIALILASIAAIMAHLKRKEAGENS